MLSDREIKEELLQLLVQVDRVLEENRLEYSMMSGTLLGAIRHGGFIPWDDDIDLAMRREEYDRFIGLIKNGILDRIGLTATGYEVNGDHWPFLKIVNPKIKIHQEIEGAASLSDELWIDVFPFDYLPREHAEKTLKKIALQKKLLGYKIAQKKQFYRYKHGVKKAVYLLISAVFHFIPAGTFERKLIALSKGDGRKSDLIADLTWGRDDVGKCVPARLFDEIVTYSFEGVTAKGFKDYDVYLTQIYGDYRKLPPEAARINHGIKAWRVSENEE